MRAHRLREVEQEELRQPREPVVAAAIDQLVRALRQRFEAVDLMRRIGARAGECEVLASGAVERPDPRGVDLGGRVIVRRRASPVRA